MQQGWCAGSNLPAIHMATDLNWAVITTIKKRLREVRHALRVFRFMRMSSFRFSVTGWYRASHAFFSGVMRCVGTVTCAQHARTLERATAAHLKVKLRF